MGISDTPRRRLYGLGPGDHSKILRPTLAISRERNPAAEAFFRGGQSNVTKFRGISERTQRGEGELGGFTERTGVVGRMGGERVDGKAGWKLARRLETCPTRQQKLEELGL